MHRLIMQSFPEKFLLKFVFKKYDEKDQSAKTVTSCYTADTSTSCASKVQGDELLPQDVVTSALSTRRGRF
ncbi:hypothetical protein OSO01_40270 [Oceanobacillus sojae]|uniref:Uncharacterized protein n=1 Tax=Oceanobacillus sojae TaxID=582851 RepID=A0A511ZPB4_9BACI|nr:hypothetical protein OSO01_40270 [Oceanobacillus sojae]